MKTVLEYALFAGVARLLQLLPLGGVRRVARGAAWLFWNVIPIRRGLTLMQLRIAFPDKTDTEIRDIARASVVNLFTTIFELMWTPRLDEDSLRRVLRIRNPEVIVHAVRRGRGVILMTGHFGNWEWLSIGVAVLLSMPYTIIVHSIHNPRVDRLVEGWRSRFGNRTVPMGVSVREIIHTLRNRGAVAMIADQSGPSGALYVRYFGRPAATYEGPATFALRLGAPVIMGYSIRCEDGNYDVVAEEIPTQDLDGFTEANVRELTRRHVRALERKVREYPSLWLWQHKRWKHAPGPDNVVVDDPSPVGEQE
ncbi:MAG: lysophospholipid acyltransferase family protein [Bacteroidetes bacterium]|nr:lysophospholipid acyltransferase family protein [Bacteroidota bacterium]